MKKPNKNIFALILLLIIFLINSISITFANSATGDLDENPLPKIRMGGNGSVTLQANKKTEVSIPIINTSQFYAYDLLIQALIEKENSPFTIEFLNNSNRLNLIERAGSTNLKMLINVDKNAPSGTYPVKLEFSYTSSKKVSYNNSDTLLIKIDNKNTTPSIVLSNFSASKDKVFLGNDFSINTTLENNGGIDAKNVTLEILGLDDSNISLLKSSNSMYFEEYSSGNKNILKFDFTTSKLTKQGSNKITFKLKFFDMAGKEYTREFQYYITVLKDANDLDELADISITDISSPKNTLNVNENGTFTLKIKNNGKAEVKNIKVTAKTPEGIVPTSSNTIVIPSVLPNKEQIVNFNVAPTAAAKNQTYSVGFIVEYGSNGTGEDKKPISVEQYAGINVNNPNPTVEGDKKKISVPKIIISKYKSTPLTVEAGKPFNLAMTFKNTHSEKTVQNIKIYLTVDDKTAEKGAVFAPDNSSTTFYIPKILPNQEINHTFDLFTVNDAKPRSYTVNVNFEYEDEQANEYKSIELVGINVKQQSKLEVSDIKFEKNAIVGEQSYLSFQLYNTGKVNLANLKIELQGENLDTSTATNFIGNFDSGGSEYYDATFIPTSAGELNGEVIISYEDPSGEQINIKEPFKINAEEMVKNDTEIIEEIPNQKKSFSKTIIKIITVIIIIALIIFIFIKRRSKLKKEFDFNE